MTTTEKKPTYETIKADQINPNDLGSYAKSNAQSIRKSDSSAGKVWAITTLMLNVVKPLSSYDTTKEIKEIADDIRATFKTAFLDNYEDFPMEGRNARTGKIMDICDKNGDPKWSSWEETKTPISYCGDLAKVLKAGLVDNLIKNETSVMSKSSILAMAKGNEPAIKTIERSCDLIGKKLSDLSDSDLKTAKGLLEARVKEASDLLKDLEEALAQA